MPGISQYWNQHSSLGFSHGLCANDEYWSQVGATNRPENIITRYFSFVSLFSVSRSQPMRESKTSIYFDDISGRSLVRRTGLVFFSNLIKCIKNQKETLKNELEKKIKLKMINTWFELF
jgi:hypothetical protein